MIVPCLHCYAAVRVIGDIATVNALVGGNSEFYPDKYACVVCEKPCTINCWYTA